MGSASRDRQKESFWRRAIQDQPGSGLTVRAWCARQHLRESSYYWWRRELARRDAESPTLVPVRITADSPARDTLDWSLRNESRGGIEIILPDEHRVRVTGPVDRQALSDVLAVLSSAKLIAPEASAC